MREAEIFEAAIAIDDVRRRESFLDRACGGDATLRRALEELLDIHDACSGLGDGPARLLREMVDAVGNPEHQAGEAAGVAGGPRLGATIDGITILRGLGEGGFGRVYEGWQASTRRRVAVKVLKRELAGPGTHARFVREWRLLARLSHPGIAAVHSVGSCVVDGREVPYLVAELVEDGKRITEAAGQLDVRGRVELLLAVCDAVAHSHERGVVHRDLKPANILVDGAGNPKVIDFGWAHGTDTEITQATMLTEAGQVVGTWQYMSPEQFAAGASVGATGDVYSLGVMAYELFAGRPPYDVRGRPVPEIAALVQGAIPVSLQRTTRGVPAPVSRVVDRCLRKDPAERYPTARELADDLRRFLSGVPVLAAPPSFLESLSMLAGRHRAGTAALAGVVLGLLVAVAGITRYAVEADRARRAEAEAHDVAQRRLYASTLHRIASASERGDTREAMALAAQLVESPAILDSGTTDGEPSSPIEMRCAMAAIDGPSQTFDMRPARVMDVARSPDSATLAAVCDDGLVHLRSVSDGQPITVLRCGQGRPRQIVFSPDGRLLAATTADGSTWLWETSTYRVRATLVGPGRTVTGLAFSPDSSRIVTGSTDGTCRLWRSSDGGPAGEITGHDGRVNCLAWSPDGTRIVTGSTDRTFRLWNADDGTWIATRRTDLGSVTHVAFSPDSRVVAAGGRQGKVILWDHVGGSADIVIADVGSAIVDLAFSPDGRFLATTAYDRTVRLWLAVSGTPHGRPGRHQARPSSMAFSPDSTRLATGSNEGGIRLWDTGTGEIVRSLCGHTDTVSALSFLSDGRQLASGSADGSVKLWDRPETDPHAVVQAGSPIVFAAVGSDGRRAIVGSRRGEIVVIDPVGLVEVDSVQAPGSQWSAFAASSELGMVAAGSHSGTLRLWNRGDGTTRLVKRAHDDRINAIAFSADGARVVTASRDDTLKIWDATAGTPSADLVGHAAQVNAVSFSPDGATIASASSDGTARLWNASDGTLRHVLVGHSGDVLQVLHSPDGGHVVTAGDDGSIRVWSVSEGVAIKAIDRGIGAIRSLVFSADGRLLASLHDRAIGRIWDTATWREVAEIAVQGKSTETIAFSPDGRRVVTGGQDGALRLWDSADGMELMVLRGDGQAIGAAVFGPDGRSLLSGAVDGTVRVWGRSMAEAYAARQVDSAPATGR